MSRNSLIPINIEQARSRLLESFNDAWYESAQTTSKLKNLLELYKIDNMACHINTNLTKGKKAIISQLRCGVLGLNIEVRRYHGLERELRSCNICKTDSVEDELHFLFECNAYHECRTELYNKYPELLNEPMLTKRFAKLCRTPYAMGDFVYKLWTERSKIHKNICTY